VPSRFASGKNAIAECDRCGFRYKLTDLKTLVIKTKNVNIKVCPECWEPDQPQLQLGLYPVNDPQALRDPRPDISYYTPTGAAGGDGGSRVIQWGWNPVGLNTSLFSSTMNGSGPSNSAVSPGSGVQNDLVAYGVVGTVTATGPVDAEVTVTYLTTTGYLGETSAITPGEV